MLALKLKQFEYELDTWISSLEYIVDGNIRLKNRLSDILKDKFDKYLLEEVDDFQNRFINIDELVSLIRNDIAELNKLFERNLFEKGKLKPEIDRKVKLIRSNLNTVEKRFTRLKSDFNTFLSAYIL